MEHLLMVAALLILLSGCCQTSSKGHPSVEAFYTPQVSAPASPPNRPEPEDSIKPSHGEGQDAAGERRKAGNLSSIGWGALAASATARRDSSHIT